MDCGGVDGTPVTVTVRNTGTTPTEWKAAIDGTTVFQLSGTTRGILPASGSVTFAVTAKAVDAKVARAGEVTSGSLRVGPPGVLEQTSTVQVRRTAKGPESRFCRAR